MHELSAAVSAAVGFDALRRRAYVAALNGDLEALDVPEPSGAMLVQGEGTMCQSDASKTCERYIALSKHASMTCACMLRQYICTSTCVSLSGT